MERFRIDSINQMALKQIAAAQISGQSGPFVLGQPDEKLKSLAPAEHPLAQFMLRLMHDEALEVEAQNELAALAVQVIHFGDIDPLLQFVHQKILDEGRPQHVVSLKTNKMLRDVLHLAHGHQEEFRQVFSGEGSGATPPPPPKPAPEKQKVIMVPDELEPPSGQARWSPIRATSYQAPPAANRGETVERVTTVEKSTLSPGMVTFGIALTVIPLAIAVGTNVGMINKDSDQGWSAFFLVLLPSLLLVTFVGSLSHWIWKYFREEK